MHNSPRACLNSPPEQCLGGVRQSPEVVKLMQNAEFLIMHYEL